MAMLPGSGISVYGVVNPGQGNEQLVPIYNQNPGEFDCSKYTFTTYRISGGNAIMCLAGASALRTAGGGGGVIDPVVQVVASSPYQGRETDNSTYWRIRFAVPADTGVSRDGGTHWRLTLNGQTVLDDLNTVDVHEQGDGTLVINCGPEMYADAEALVLEEVTNVKQF